MRFDRPLTFDGIRWLWLQRNDIVNVWLEKEAGIAKISQLPILIPKREVTLKINSETKQNLVTYLKNEILHPDPTLETAKHIGKFRLIFLPIFLKDRWLTVFIAVSKENLIASVGYMDSFISETTLDRLLSEMGVPFHRKSFIDKCELLNEASQKPGCSVTLDEKPLLQLDALKSQLQEADPRFKLPLYQKYAYVTDNKSVSGFVCLKNAIELTKIAYLGKRYKVLPTWLNEDAIIDLRTEYLTLPRVRLHSAIPFSDNSLLIELWQSIEKEIIDYLSQRLSEHYVLFKQHGGLMSAEADHLSHYLESLKVIRDEIKEACAAFLALETRIQRKNFILETIPKIKFKLLWFDSVLRNLVLTGNDHRYLVSQPKGCSDNMPMYPIEEALDVKRYILRKSIVAAKNTGLTKPLYFICLKQLLADCHTEIISTITRLTSAYDQLKAIITAEQPKVGDHTQPAIIAALSKASASPYEYLGVDRDTEEADIKQAYKKRSRYAHPDKGGHAEWMQRLANAKDIVLDIEKRAELDKKLDTIAELEDGDVAIETFLGSDAVPISHNYRAWHSKLKTIYTKTPLKIGSVRSYFKAIATTDSPLYQRQIRRIEKRPTERILQRSVEYQELRMPEGRDWERLAYAITSTVGWIGLIVEKLLEEEPNRSDLELKDWLIIALFMMGSFIYLIIKLKPFLQAPVPITLTQMEDYTVTERVDTVVSETVQANDVFSFIKSITKDPSLHEIEFTGRLSLEKAITLFRRFLRGQYVGQSLLNLRVYFTNEIKRLQVSGLSEDQLSLLYLGIFEVISRVQLPKNQYDDWLTELNGFSVLPQQSKQAPPEPPLLFSLQKITDYIQKTGYKNLSVFLPLLQDRYFRLLFSQALYAYWTSPFSILTGPNGFNGQETLIQRISEYIETDELTQSQVNQLHRMKRIQQFEQLLRETGRSSDPDEWRAEDYRKKAYLCIDSIQLLKGLLNPLMHINLLIQAGVYFQCASCFGEPVRKSEHPERRGRDAEMSAQLRMADQRLALEMYSTVIEMGEKESPQITLYAYLQTLRYMAQFHYQDPLLAKTISGFQHRALLLTNLFPFFRPHQPTVDCFDDQSSPLYLIQQLLLFLLDNNSVSHDKRRVIYTAYEACLAGWYPAGGEPHLAEKFRQQFMRESLGHAQWQFEDVNRNINFPWRMIDRNREGWLQPVSALSLPKHRSITVFQSIKGVEVNHRTGKITLLVKPCSSESALYKRRLTNLDITDMFERNLSHGEFSLNKIDPDFKYHPFQTLWFSPSILYGSEFLNTMFLSDYLLKFFVVGTQVQGTQPYAMKPVNELIEHLPGHLKKIITDFHAHSSMQEELAHRFWIETEGLPVGLPDDEQADLTLQRFLFGKLRMVVKKHRLARNEKGELVDDPREKKEGWPLYVITALQLKQWQDSQLGLPEHAMVFLENSNKVYFIEDTQLPAPFLLECDHTQLQQLFEQERKASGKVIRNSQNSYFLMHFTRNIAAEAQIPDHFTREYIFAQELSAHYDEFAKYLPEFGRLKALSYVTVLIRCLNAVRTNNEYNIKRFQEILTNPQHTVRLDSERLSLTEVFRVNWKKITAPKVSSLLQSREMAGLSINLHSKTVRLYCQRIDKKKKSDYIAQHGWFSRFSSHYSSLELEQVIEKEGPGIVARLSAERRRKLKEQITGQYKKSLSSKWSAQRQAACIEAYLDGDAIPLAFAISIAEGKYKNELERFKRELSTSLSLDEWLLALLKDQHTTEELVKRIKGRANPLTRAWQEQYEQIKREASRKLEQLQSLKQSLAAMGLGPENQEKSLDSVCTWVPAAFNNDIRELRSYFIYGGVGIVPTLHFFRGTNPITQSMLRTVSSNSQIVRWDSGELSKKKQEAEQSMPTNYSTSNLAQRYRFFSDRK